MHKYSCWKNWIRYRTRTHHRIIYPFFPVYNPFKNLWNCTDPCFTSSDINVCDETRMHMVARVSHVFLTLTQLCKVLFAVILVLNIHIAADIWCHINCYFRQSGWCSHGPCILNLGNPGNAIIHLTWARSTIPLRATSPRIQAATLGTFL